MILKEREREKKKEKNGKKEEHGDEIRGMLIECMCVCVCVCVFCIEFFIFLLQPENAWA